MKRRAHSREFKLEVARQVVNGEKRPAQVCREHNLANGVLDRWRKEYEQRGEAAFTKHAAEAPGFQPWGGSRTARQCGQRTM